MLSLAEIVTALSGVCAEEQDWGLEVHVESTVRLTYHMYAANIGKTNWRDRSDQTCGQWHQNVLQIIARTRRDTSCLNPGNWDMIFLLQQTFSAVLWFSIPGTLHTGTSHADLEAIVKKSHYIMAWGGKGIIHCKIKS